MSTPAVKTTPATLANLQTAFQGESNAHARYIQFAIRADEDGFPGVASLFRAAACAEQIHANNHANVIRKMGGTAQIKLEPVTLRSTRDNLRAAIAGECHERDVMYPEFLKAAQAEKNTAAIRTFTFALEAETEHARLFHDALDSLETRRPRLTYLVCAVCGFTAEKLMAERCPVCNLQKERFERVS